MTQRTETYDDEHWQLVPKEPTDLMTARGQAARPNTANSISVIYEEMLAAAPTLLVSRRVRALYTMDQMRDYAEAYYTSRKATAPPVATPVEVTDIFRDLIEALIDIDDDAKNNDPAHRCYVEGAFELTMSDARDALAQRGEKT